MEEIQKYYNRELSWLSFNERVLQEAQNKSVPLIERLKFLAIYSSNLNEFFRVRVAMQRSLLKQDKHRDKAKNLLDKIYKTVNRQQQNFRKVFENEILKELTQHNIYLVNEFELSDIHKNFIKSFYHNAVHQHIEIVPLTHKSFLENNVNYLAVEVFGGSVPFYLIKIPRQINRFITLPQIDEKFSIIFLDDILRLSMKEILPNEDLGEIYSIKLTRDADIHLEDEFSGDLIEKLEKKLAKRDYGTPARFQYDRALPENQLNLIKSILKLEEEDLVPGAKYNNWSDFFSFPNPLSPELENTKLPPLTYPELEKYSSYFDAITDRDWLLSVPYQSYDYFINFLNEAAFDKKVTHIKITIYRVASNSRVIKALVKALKNGKKVTVFQEIKARFDEESNLYWAGILEKAGANVLYSYPGLKVHSKLAIVSRKESGKKNHYAFLSTGNFNEKTSLIYGDHGLFTKHKGITKEVNYIFEFLEDFRKRFEFEHLLVAPDHMRSDLYEMIDQEIKHALKGKKASIILKMNSLQDKKMIDKLYEASQEGVKIKLIVRGICCLVPQVKGLSENIEVVSIVDRFLEHVRAFVFHNNGDTKVYISSADLMTRNLSKRVEAAIPIYDENIKKEIIDILKLQLKDNVKARIIDVKQSNSFKKGKTDEKIQSQIATYEYLQKKRLKKS